jgi:hypothetical protein
MLAASLVPAAVKLGTSLYQMYEGSQLGKAQQPQYQISEGMQNALKNSQMLAAQRELPGQSIMEDQLRGSTAGAINAINQMGGGGAGMGAALQAYGNEQQGLQNIALQGAQRYDQNQQQLMNMQQQIGTMQDKQWNLNEYLPWQDKMTQASDMKGAGISNLFGATTDSAQAITDWETGNQVDANNKKFTGMLEQMMGILNEINTKKK